MTTDRRPTVDISLEEDLALTEGAPTQGDPEDSGELLESRPLPDFATYRAAGIFNNVQNMLAFDLRVEVPKMYHWIGTDWAEIIAGRMYEEVLVTLESAGFFSFDKLATVTSNQKAGVQFSDDEYHFEVMFDEDGDLHIQRGGSALEDFYNWYDHFMPSATSLVNKILHALAETVSLRYDPRAEALTHRRRELKPVAVSYNFSFLAYDFRRPPSKEIDKNVAILRELLKVVPGAGGQLQDTGHVEDLSHFGRIDVTLSRFVEDIPEVWAREIYNIQGPSNRRYTTLWLYFIYRGESFETPAGVRQKFDSDRFLSAYEVPIASFLRDRAIENFLAQLTRGYVFETSTGTLP